MNGHDSFLMGAACAAIEAAASFDAMADNFASAMFAFGRQGVDGAFETVEVVRDSINDDFDGFVVFISASFTSVHIFLSKR